MTTRLAELLALRRPEQVAVLGAEGNWYSSGYRVRGENVKIQERSRQVFLVTPGIGRQNRSDWNQTHLEPAFCLQLVVPATPPHHVNIISDSTLANSAFLYGIAQKLRSKGTFLLWSGVLPGECLQEAWEQGLIDCTWHCSLVCRASVTGAGKDRWSRPAADRARFTWQ